MRALDLARFVDRDAQRLGVALIYGAYGTVSNATLAPVVTGEAPRVVWIAGGLMLIGLMIKAALFPVHFWLPPAHGGAPAPISALLSALVVKASFYLTLRLWIGPFAPLIAATEWLTWLSDGTTVADMDWAIWVLWTSSLLNAAYLLPILWRAWFRPAPAQWTEEHIPACGWLETAWLLPVPPLITAITTLAAGMLAETPCSPLDWAKLIAEREYRQGASLP